MYTYLIVDDEMIERKGIRMLLSRMNIRENILEASNGEEALEVFEKEKIDVLLTDINMPFMDGIELLSRIHEAYPGTETVIFSGYDEFSYAKKAISYGVSAYILKPVNPEEFEKVVGEINEKLAKSEREEKRKDESMEFLREHLLYLMVNGQSRSAMQEKTQMLLDMSFVRDFRRMVLLECANNYFEQVNSEQIEKMQSDLQMPFHYLNLNPQQSILFFSEEPDGGWEAFGRKLYRYIREMWDQECFLAVSGEITPDCELYDAFAQTEQLMERRFYHTGNHVFLPFQEEQSEVLVQIDAEILIRQIQQDIRMKDLESLREHFDQFCEKYEHQTIFSQIYIKFMFSNLLKEIYDNLERKDERELDREIDALYHSSNMVGVIQAVRMGIERLETVFRADGGVAKRREVEQIKQYIRDGHIFQTVLSQRWTIATGQDGFDLYCELRELNPSPYLYYFNFGDFEVIGSSPEMLVKQQGNKVFTCPIAGTRPRGKTKEEDDRLHRELLADEKERAEHVMLVDLARNDMGRISEFGTVKVTDFMSVKNYSHVMHIVSMVEGRKKGSFHPFDLLASFLPAGTLSGAPKIRAMEIIEELESVRRGLYGGATGYVDFSGDMDFCITIRTMIKKGKNVYLQAGAGIVADSVPENEYKECCNKVMALAKTLVEEENL